MVDGGTIRKLSRLTFHIRIEDGHFEHPGWLSGVFSHVERRDALRSPRECSAAC